MTRLLASIPATRLLVSVRSAEEASAALAGGADLIDIKEPAHGALGAADNATMAAIVAAVAGRVPVSAALGELASPAMLDDSFAGQITFAKFGLAGCGADRNWSRRWIAACGELPAGTAPVAVAYGDWQSAGAPEPWHILELAQDANCGAFLLDTFEKGHGSLLSTMMLDEIERLIKGARAAGLLSVIAGGLGLSDLENILPLQPDYVGVRGAVCVGGRSGALDHDRVRDLASYVGQQRVHQQAVHQPSVHQSRSMRLPIAKNT